MHFVCTEIAKQWCQFYLHANILDTAAVIHINNVNWDQQAVVVVAVEAKKLYISCMHVNLYLYKALITAKTENRICASNLVKFRQCQLFLLLVHLIITKRTIIGNTNFTYNFRHTIDQNWQYNLHFWYSLLKWLQSFEHFDSYTHCKTFIVAFFV